MARSNFRRYAFSRRAMAPTFADDDRVTWVVPCRVVAGREQFVNSRHCPGAARVALTKRADEFSQNQIPVPTWDMTHLHLPLALRRNDSPKLITTGTSCPSWVFAA